VGIVEKDAIVDGRHTIAGDLIIGLPSSGPHSNGYSLIRKLLKHSGSDERTRLGESTLYDTLLAPTRIYVKPLLALLTEVPVRGFAHITGGGLLDNIPRVIPGGLEVVLNSHAWERPAVFGWLQNAGNITDEHMHRTFNCGIGMIACVAPQHVDSALRSLRDNGEAPVVIGEVRRGDGGVVMHG
jgi:phosphoribosylformylglycinamidine cyclo-ligase